jgi:transcriptional regulator with XRE-family HTH domain
MVRNLTSENPDPIDVAVGARIRTLRRGMALSQKALASALGVTFQQVQKYEKGTNRVSASMLVRAGARLETTVAFLVGEAVSEKSSPIVGVVLDTPGAIELLAFYSAIEETEARRALVEVAEALARAQTRKAWVRRGRREHQH